MNGDRGSLTTDYVWRCVYLHSYNNAHKEIELIKIQFSGSIHIQHVKHFVNLMPGQVSDAAHEIVELQVWKWDENKCGKCYDNIIANSK